jgi:peptidyl-prolyl cis-trans isomerase A (cyclophilin A)
MIKRRGILAGLSLLAAQLGLGRAALAQQPTPVPPPGDFGGVRFVMQTSLGAVTVEVYPQKAPITAGHFLALVDQKRLDGGTFYRAVRPGPDVTDFGVVQGGVKYDAKRPIKAIAHEPTSQTGVYHVDGAISMGRNAPGTAVSDFFICVGPQRSYDADPTQPGDNLGYAAFGRVVEGMDIIKQILVAPISPTKGEGGMRGQMLETPVPIVSARRA